jgi:hypothetical protein
MKKSIKELNSIDLDDLIAEVENHSVEVENKLVAMLARRYSYDVTPLPVFDYEIN